MAHSAEIQFQDGTPVRFLLAPEATDEHGHEYEYEYEYEYVDEDVAADEEDLPDGMGPSVPVARGNPRRAQRRRRPAGEVVADVATTALRGTLRPLGPLLQEVHDAVSAAPQPPSEITVTLGVQVGQDLKLGIVGGTGKAHLTVTATWSPAAGAHGAAGADGAGEGGVAGAARRALDASPPE
ncbi:CU044_2847 family protein [Streptomyces sp. NPDC047315]|uniref:CU044_2847 family protein n=1 Tax=Streptomyces sp. NPDC047315 TaxID=3155142 RepID=UPI0033CA9315